MARGPMTDLVATHVENQSGRKSGRGRRARGVVVLVMGGLAVLSPFMAGTLALLLVGPFLIACGVPAVGRRPVVLVALIHVRPPRSGRRQAGRP